MDVGVLAINPTIQFPVLQIQQNFLASLGFIFLTFKIRTELSALQGYCEN